MVNKIHEITYKDHAWDGFSAYSNNPHKNLFLAKIAQHLRDLRPAKQVGPRAYGEAAANHRRAHNFFFGCIQLELFCDDAGVCPIKMRQVAQRILNGDLVITAQMLRHEAQKRVGKQCKTKH